MTPEWSRRALLRAGTAAVGGALAGCVDGSAGDSSPSSPPRDALRTEAAREDPPTPDPADSGLPRRVAVESVADSDLRENLGVEASASVVEPKATAAHAASVRVTLRNAGESARELTFVRDACDLDLYFGRSRPDGRFELLLAPAAVGWERPEGTCWTPDPRDLSCGVPVSEETVSLSPGEREARTYRLWVNPDDADGEVCMPSGTYRFVREFRAEGTSHGLGFDIAVGGG